MSCGEGGIITTNNRKYAELCRKIGGHGFKNLKAKEGRIKFDSSVFQKPHYKRHSCIGWNYRLPEFNAAIALAQLEELEELVEKRIKCANFFLEEIADCSYLTPQLVPKNKIHSYWSLCLKYESKNNKNISWKNFRKKYIELGGDGFFGAWSVPYLEPAISTGKFKECNFNIYKNLEYPKGLCPVAEKAQAKIMQFKTNYRSMKIAAKKAKALSDTIKFFNKL